MRASIAAIFAGVLAMTTPALAQTPAPAPTPPPVGPVDVVTYVETAPDWANNAMDALRAYRDATLKEDGALRIGLYRETTRQNRFVVEELWRDVYAQEAHAKSTALAEALRAGHLAPPDRRPHTEWNVATSDQTPAPDALFVFTHIDVSPPQLAALQTILTPYLEKSRTDKGALRFDLAQGLLPRRNHQTLAESWASEADFLAHQRSPHAVDFRDKLGPLLGALYDQRLYRLVK